MTKPKVRTVQQGGSRFYVHPETRRKVPGVTSVVGMLPKTFLQFWAAKLVAETAMLHPGRVVDFALTDPKAGIEWLKGAPRRLTSEAADAGDEVHQMIEKLALGEKVGRIHPDYSGFIEGYRTFLKNFEPEFLHVEATVWNYEHGYAGSLDAIVRMVVEEGGEPVTLVIDNKTTRSGVHDEVALQMAAYANADVIIDKDGKESPMPKIDGAGVVWLRPEEWGFFPVKIIGGLYLPRMIDGEMVDELVTPFDVFKAQLVIHFWDKELSKVVVGSPLTERSK